MAATTRPPVDIGTFRKIRLPLKPHSNGVYYLYFCDAERGYRTTSHSTGAKVLAQAEAYLDQFCRDRLAELQAAGPLVVLVKPTVDQLCARWIDDAAVHGKHRSNGYVLNPVRRLLGRYRVDDLVADPQILRSYRGERDQLAQRTGRVGDWTVRRELGALQTVVRWADEQKLIDLPELPKFKLPAPGAPRDKFLDRGQEQWFWDQAMAWGHQAHDHPLRTAQAPRVMLFVALALETAARRGAILDLTWDRVDLTRGRIAYKVPGRRESKKRRPDPLPISRRLRPVLEEAYRAAPKDPSGKACGRVIDTAIEDSFRVFTQAIGMAWVTPHVLRHSWASLAAMAGRSMYEISRVMADSIAMIDKHYAHLAPGHLEDIINFKEPAPGLRVVA